MTRLRRAVLALLAAVLVAGSVAVFAVREVHIPGHRGARRVVSGFVPGRWDARFLVARGPAALELPAIPVRVEATLSGPARVEASTASARVSLALGAEPEATPFDLPQGGRVTLEGDGTLRLHALHVRRTGGPSLSFAALVLRAWWDRARAVVVLLGLVMALGAGAFAGGRAGIAPPPSRLAVAAALIVLVSCVAQVLLAPQPKIIGDPGAYYDMAGRFRDAMGSPSGLAEWIYDLRPYAGLAFTATLYGALRLLRDAPSTLYLAQALAMSGAVFFLVRAAARAFGPRTAAVTGVLAAGYATFPIVCGIVQPEPFILLLWSWTLDRIVAVAQGEASRRLVPAGLAFGLGLALHPQGIWYLLAAAALVLLPFAWALRRPAVRAGTSAFVLGLLPVAMATSVGESYARPAVHVLDQRYGFFAYTVSYPLGFWLFLETDGWQAGLRLDETRYVRELAAAEERGDVQGGGQAWLFTARFVAGHGTASLRAVLRNLYRLYARPDNPFHRTWILPYGLQLGWHRVLIVLFVLSVPLLMRSAAAAAIVAVAMLAATYPLYHVFNKYALPATPFVLLGAAVVITRLVETRPRRLLISLAAAGAAAVVTPAALVFMGVPVVAARWGLLIAFFLALVAALVWAVRAWGAGVLARGTAGVAAAGLLCALAGAAWNDPSWRTFTVAAAEAPRQEILLTHLDEARLSSAPAFLALDLQLLDGDPSDLRFEFDGGLLVHGAELLPTMPPFGLATFRGDRDPRRLPQWWTLTWRPEMAPGGRMGLVLRGDATSRLAGDVGTDPLGSHHGRSLGQRPHLSVYRLMHEGEYRLPVHLPIAPSDRRSLRRGQPIVGTYGVRVVALEDDGAGAEWETAVAPAGEIVTAVWARAGRGGSAAMMTPEGPVEFELGAQGPWTGPGGELRFMPTGDSEGWYLLRRPGARGGASSMRVVIRPEMTAVPRFFLPELRASPAVPPEWSHLPIVPATRVVDAREARAWRAAAVY